MLEEVCACMYESKQIFKFTNHPSIFRGGLWSGMHLWIEKFKSTRYVASPPAFPNLVSAHGFFSMDYKF